MEIHNLVQRSPEWHAHRDSHDNASDAPAMLGCSPYKTRNELLQEYATGGTKEVSAVTQRLFDEGHRSEVLARAIAEKIIGEDLYPVVGSNGRYSASFDGLTMEERIGFEHKSLNDTLRDVLHADCKGFELPLHYRVQMEQQCMVSGCERILFMASKWDGETLIEERHCWYNPDPALRMQIVAGWEQFERDVAAYVPPPALPVVVAEPVQALPSVLVQVTGEIAIKDNFKAFEIALRDFLEHRLIREPKTDQDFADLDVQIKAMKGAEAALDSVEAQMLAQIQAVDTAKKAKDMLAKLVRDNRLMAEKLLSSEKERRRGEIVSSGITALREHCAALTERIGKPYLPTITADFAGAIKGMRSLASMEDAIATTLVNAKIEANATADRIQTNLTKLREQAGQHTFLFNDTAQLVLKAPDDCQSAITARIAEHKAAEEKRLEEQRVRIAEEERIKAEAKAKADAEQTAPSIAAPPAPTSTAHVMPGGTRQIIAQSAADTSTRIKLGDITARLGMGVSAEFLASLGFQPVSTERGGKWYRACDFKTICAAIIRHVEFVAQETAEAA